MAIKNMAASVLTRLKNQSKEEGIPFQMVLQLFAQEEFLRKLSLSQYADNLILKGGMFIYTLTEFDSRPTRDIDFLIKNLHGSLENIEHIMRDMPEFMKPKNVGLLFFSMEPEKFFPCAQIDVVEFPEGVGGDRIEEKTFKGPLHQQLRDALRHIKNSVIKERVVKHGDRAEADRFFNYPYAAIEESLANAIYHKAYDVREPIEVRVERDKIEILSFPGPDRLVTVEALKNFNVYVRRYRNRRIGDFLKELHLTEGRNTGFGKILNALSQNGSPLPEFITDEDHSFFVTRLFIHEKFYDADENVSENVIENVIEKKAPATCKTLQKYSTIKQKTAKSIIDKILDDGSMSMLQIAKDTGISERSDTIITVL